MTTINARRIAIAKACGWRYNLEGVYESWFDPSGSEWQVMHGWQTYKDGSDIIPDYPNDLNAMREALLTLDDGQAISYRCILTQMAVDHNFDPMMASAGQQAEAFLKTLNLYPLTQ